MAIFVMLYHPRCQSCGELSGKSLQVGGDVQVSRDGAEWEVTLLGVSDGELSDIPPSAQEHIKDVLAAMAQAAEQRARLSC